MPDQITFNGDVVWDDETNGAGWQFYRGVIQRPVIEERAPQGTGYWIKEDGRNTATHTLDVQWRTTNISTLLAAVQAMQDTELGELVIPGHGTIPRCRFESIGDIRTTKSDDATGYIVETTLTFIEYP